MFSKSTRAYESATPEQLKAIRKAAKPFDGTVTKKSGVVIVTFRDNPARGLWATRSETELDAAVKGLNLSPFRGFLHLL